MAMDTTKDRTIAAVAAAVAIFALGTAIVLATNGDDDAPSATADAGAAPAPDTSAAASSAAGLPMIDPGELAEGESCYFDVKSADLRPDPATAAGWQELGLEMRPIMPGVGTQTGVSFKVTSSTGVTCDLHAGYVGTRGGMKFTLGENSLDLRRTRLDFGTGLMRMFPKSTGFDGIEASGLTLGKSTVVQTGNEVTVIVPLRATPDVAGQMNLALGQEVFSGDATVGTFHLVGERKIVNEA